MKDLVLQRMDDMGCVPAVRDLIERRPDDESLVVQPNRATRLLVGADLHCDAALYVNPAHVQIKLDVPDGVALGERTGFHVGVKGPTAYVRVTAAGLADPRWTREIDDAVSRALVRRHPAPGRAGAPALLFCPESLVALPVTGWCDDCEQVCA